MNARLLTVLLAAIAVGSCSEKETSRAVEPVKVKTMTVGTSAAAGTQTYPATIEEESGTALSFAAMGTVQTVNVAEGQLVRQGQLIAQLDATAARNAYDAALAMKEQALDAQQRMQLLHDGGSLPDIKWVEVQTQVRQALASEEIARKGLADTRLLAPYSGYVAQKSVETGANVGPGVPVVRLVRIDRVKVSLGVPEEEVSAFSMGMTLRVSVAALGGRMFDATVTERGVSADPLSRSYEVKAVIDNPGHELLPGMLAEVEKPTPTPPQERGLVTLPAAIVQLSADNRTFVWTVVDGKARQTFITTTDNIGPQVLVAEGLAPGDVVICQGQQKVSSGMDVTTE